MTNERDMRAGTGVPGLNEILNGGYPRDHLYLINGPSGAGKTTMSLQFLMEGAARGEASLYLGTAETESDIALVARSHGWDLSGVAVRHYGGPADDEDIPRQTMLLPVEVELPRTMEQLMAIVEEVNPQRLVIDSLSEIRLLSGEMSWFRHQIAALKQYFSDRRCTVLLTDLFDQSQSLLRSGVHGVIELEHRPMPYGSDRRQLRVAKMRGMEYFSGFHDFAIEKGGIRVFPRLVAAQHREQREQDTVSTGVDALDALLGGGIDRGTTTLLLGPTGTGKSSLATYFAVSAARRGEQTEMYIFDERVQTLMQRAKGLGLELAEHVDSGMIRVRQIDPAELTPGQFSQAVVDAIEEGVQMVVFDSLNGYAYAMPDERSLMLHLHELLSYLSQRGITSIQVMTEHGMLGTPKVDFDLSYVADTVMLLRAYEFGGRVHKALSVLKRRAGDYEKTIREFIMEDGRIAIGPPLTKFSGVIRGNLNYLGDRSEHRPDDS